MKNIKHMRVYMKVVCNGVSGKALFIPSATPRPTIPFMNLYFNLNIPAVVDLQSGGASQIWFE